MPSTSKDFIASYIAILATVIIYRSMYSIATPLPYKGCFNRSNQSPHGQQECQDCHRHREDKLAAIPVFAYGDVATGLPTNSSTTFANKVCAICLDDYADTDVVRILPRCLHVFHKECIDKWLCVKSLQCPICRDPTIEQSLEASCGNDARVGNALPLLSIQCVTNARTISIL
ncbi:RING-H2 finger protein ATL65 [Citrus clementina]|uniref:RING-H2 finger protein ATL65 n=1 Tax=Citrus clementina TaxID=85681 RepID=UPI000CED793C|nr:RING-H2 finger protein ATL65 [Citrus x clementina]